MDNLHSGMEHMLVVDEILNLPWTCYIKDLSDFCNCKQSCLLEYPNPESKTGVSTLNGIERGPTPY